MTDQVSPGYNEPPNQLPQGADTRILGLHTEELPPTTVSELEGNPVAIRMLLHHYSTLIAERNSLRNENNTLQTYVSGYKITRANVTIGAILQLLATVFIGAGINLLTSEPSWAGGLLLACGLLMAGVGLFFSFRSAQ